MMRRSIASIGGLIAAAVSFDRRDDPRDHPGVFLSAQMVFKQNSSRMPTSTHANYQLYCQHTARTIGTDPAAAA
jgi:hypothetical protein